MNILIIGGFLGSGKTTLLIQIAKIFVSSGRFVVAVENEIGEIGIDGKYLQSEGIPLRELYGGCVCCTLTGDLRRTLESIHRTIAPDWVIIEPTGAADITFLKRDVIDRLAFVERHVTITIVDPTRHFMLMEMMTPLLKSQIDSADRVAINKIDTVGTHEIERVVRSVKDMTKDVIPVTLISADNKTNIHELLNGII